MRQAEGMAELVRHELPRQSTVEEDRVGLRHAGPRAVDGRMDVDDALVRARIESGRPRGCRPGAANEWNRAPGRGLESLKPRRHGPGEPRLPIRRLAVEGVGLVEDDVLHLVAAERLRAPGHENDQDALRADDRRRERRAGRRCECQGETEERDRNQPPPHRATTRRPAEACPRSAAA
jgi:hypothetical protein